MARLLLSALIIGALAFSTIVDSPDEVNPPLQLVDETRDGGTSFPPGTPSPSPSTPDPSAPGDEDETPEPADAPSGDQQSDEASGLAAMPVAAQAGLSLGVILLAVVALLPGRRPPSNLHAS